MKMKRWIALALALVMVLAMAACGKGDDGTTGANGGTTGTTAPEGDMEYTVTVQDLLGNPYTENVIVIFKQNGEQIAMQPVNAEGKAIKKLPAGTYDVELQMTTHAEDYYHNAEGLQVTETNASLEVIVSNVLGDAFEVLTVNGLGRKVYEVAVTPASEGATEGTLVLTDLSGELDGTYNYAIDENGNYVITTTEGEDTGMSILKNLLTKEFMLSCPGMNLAQTMVQEGAEKGVLKGTYEVHSNEYNAYSVKEGCTYMELADDERNFLMFTPVRGGIYEIKIHDTTATVGYYGSPYFVQLENSAEEIVDAQTIRLHIKDSMVGSGDTGTAQMVLGIDVAEGVASGIISIERLGDVPVSPVDMPWNDYTTEFVPTKYTLPEGLTLVDFDLTASYEIVYNEADGYYHVGSADGAIVLVRMDGTLTYGATFGLMLSASNVGVYFYDEEGNFQDKVLYNQCLGSYLGTLNKGMGSYTYTGGMLDDTYDVYPLTQDLMHIIQTYGEYTGWWNAEAENYLFDTLPGLNVESAWLFMCCYAQAA